MANVPRKNPATQPQRKITLSESVSNPQGNDGSANTKFKAKISKKPIGMQKTGPGIQKS